MCFDSNFDDTNQYLCEMITKKIILRVVCDVMHLDSKDVLQPNNVKGARQRELVECRNLCMHFARKYKLGTLASICGYYGRRKYTTGIYAEKVIARDNELYTDKKDLYDRICLELMTIQVNDSDEIARQIGILSEFDYMSEEVSIENLQYQIPR